MKNPNFNLCLYNFNIPKFHFYCKFFDDTDNTTVLKWQKRKRKKLNFKQDNWDTHPFPRLFVSIAVWVNMTDDYRWNHIFCDNNKTSGNHYFYQTPPSSPHSFFSCIFFSHLPHQVVLLYFPSSRGPYYF